MRQICFEYLRVMPLIKYVEGRKCSSFTRVRVDYLFIFFLLVPKCFWLFSKSSSLCQMWFHTSRFFHFSQYDLSSFKVISIISKFSTSPKVISLFPIVFHLFQMNFISSKNVWVLVCVSHLFQTAFHFQSVVLLPLRVSHFFQKYFDSSNVVSLLRMLSEFPQTCLSFPDII